MTPVLFIAYHFPPIGGAGVQRSQKFVRYLPGEGFLPIVITGPGPSEDRWTPHDQALTEGFPVNIQVFRAAGPIPGTNGQWITKLGRWLASPDAFSQWWIRAGADIAARSKDGAKLIFATMSPFSTAEFASDLSQSTGIPWIADLRDPWALDEMQISPSRLHRKLERARMERWLSTAAGIIMNTPEATTALLEAFPSIKEKPLATITNGYDAADFAGEASPRADDKFRIVHTGYLHTDIGLQVQKRRHVYGLLGAMQSGVEIATRSHIVLVQALERWSDRHPEVGQNLEIVFAGVTTERDRSVAMNSKLSDRIRFTGYVSHGESIQLIRTADLLFLPMHNLPVGKRSRIVPGKTYEYMAAGRPILAAVPDGDARDFLEKSGTAFLCRPDDVDGMIQHLDQVYGAWKKRVSVGKPNLDFIKRFERRHLTHKLAEFFNKVLADNEGSEVPAKALTHA